jgi:hypothetical protein
MSVLGTSPINTDTCNHDLTVVAISLRPFGPKQLRPATSQNHLREQMEPTLNSRVECLTQLLTQVVLTSSPELCFVRKDVLLKPRDQSEPSA